MTRVSQRPLTTAGTTVTGNDRGGLVRSDETAARRKSDDIQLWRCRESNPGPPATQQGFYGRIPSALFSAPAIPGTSRRRAQPREFPSVTRGLILRLSPLAMPDSRSGAILDRQIPTPGSRAS